jgi:hypothetical protein
MLLNTAENSNAHKRPRMQTWLLARGAIQATAVPLDFWKKSKLKRSVKGGIADIEHQISIRGYLCFNRLKTLG